MSKASEALDSVVTRPRSAEEIQREWNTAPAPIVVVNNGKEVELPSVPGQASRIIGALRPAVDD
jgi:hypothetical protein